MHTPITCLHAYLIHLFVLNNSQFYVFLKEKQSTEIADPESVGRKQRGRGDG